MTVGGYFVLSRRETIIQITIIMNKDKQQLYVSPEVAVIETQVQTVICQSNTERPTDVTNPGWGWTTE